MAQWTNRFSIALLLLFVAPSVMPQSYNGGVLGMVGTPDGTSCSTPAIPGNLEMNFERSTQTRGIDSCTGDETVNESFNNNPNCTSEENCPLTDKKSLRQLGLGIIEDSTGLEFTDATVDVRFEFESAAGAAYNEFISFMKATGSPGGCQLRYKPDDGRMNVQCEDATTTEGTISVLSPDTTYNVRVTHDGDLDVCLVNIDLASSGNWGVGDVDSYSCNGADATQTVIGWGATGVQAFAHLVDDIGYCEGLLTANTKCGRESAAN